MDNADIEYMHLALQQARDAAAMGEVPIGAVVVYEPIDPGTRKPLAPPRVIAQACNRRETDRDPAGHAEFLAMKQAARELGAWRLTGCTVYVTLEPCIMCAGLMHQARVDRCVYGACDPKAGALGTLYAIHADERLNHQFDVVSGVCEEECAGVLKSFFSQRRKAAKQLKKGNSSSVANVAPALESVSPSAVVAIPCETEDNLAAGEDDGGVGDGVSMPASDQSAAAVDTRDVSSGCVSNEATNPLESREDPHANR